MANSTKAKAATKPKRLKDLPLFRHQSGRWCKKVRGKFCYFGKIADDPKGDTAVKLWAEQKDDLLAGRTPRKVGDGLTVKEACNRYLTVQEQRRDAGEIRPRTFDELFATCEILIAAFGKRRLVEDLAADDFETLRAALAKRYGFHRLANQIQRVRSVFKYAHEAGHIDRPVRFGPFFKKPAKRVIRAHRQKNGPRMFEAIELRRIWYAAGQPLRAMIALAINCGFGNNDCGTLPVSAVDLKGGWINYPRPKTAVARRCPLWPETVELLRDAIERRPTPKDLTHDGLLFVTKYGEPWAKESTDNPVTKEMRKLLDNLELHRPGLGFYALRHTFETIGGESRDQVAVDHIMGHARDDMATVYRERISDDRLRAVVNYVHAWLFPRPTVGKVGDRGSV